MASSGVERTGLLRKGPPPGCSRVLSTSRPPSPQASHTAGRWVCRRGQPTEVTPPRQWDRAGATSPPKARSRPWAVARGCSVG